MEKNNLSEEIKRFQELMNHNSKKTDGLLSENKNNFLVELFETDEERIINLHKRAIEEQVKRKKINLGFGSFTKGAESKYSRGFEKSKQMTQIDDQNDLVTKQTPVGRGYQILMNRVEQIKGKSPEDAKLIEDFYRNGNVPKIEQFSKDEKGRTKYYNNEIKRILDYAKEFKAFDYKWRSINKVLRKERIVTNLLVRTDYFTQQLQIWEEMKLNRPGFAADIVVYVEANKWIERIVLHKEAEKSEIPPDDIIAGTPGTEDEKKPTETPTPGTEEPTDGSESGVIEMVGTTFDIDSKGSNNLYPDNCSKVTGTVQSRIDEEIINPILEVVAMIPNTTEAQLQAKKLKGKAKVNWRACVNKITASGSASRFRNNNKTAGCPAENLTFKQLATARLENAKNYLVKKLIDDNKLVWCQKDTPQIELNPNGANGDGTSGPNPAINVGYYIPKGDYNMKDYIEYNVDEGKSKISKVFAKRDEFGTPHASKKEYEQYKYTKLSVEVGFNFDLVDPDEPAALPPGNTTTPPETQVTPATPTQTPPDEVPTPATEVKSSDNIYSADFYGGEQFTVIKTKWKWRKANWVKNLFKKRGGVKLGGKSFVGKKLNTIGCAGW
jgi:hypothetical protein